jgi:hypothetical protein
MPTRFLFSRSAGRVPSAFLLPLPTSESFTVFDVGTDRPRRALHSLVMHTLTFAPFGTAPARRVSLKFWTTHDDLRITPHPPTQHFTCGRPRRSRRNTGKCVSHPLRASASYLSYT